MTDELRVHLHFAMRGAFPLRLLDLLFCTETVRYVEYGYLTPLDLLLGSPERRAAAFAQRVRTDGASEAVESAERVEVQSYDAIDGVDVSDGGRLTRPRVVVRETDGSETAVRVHGEFDAEALTSALDGTVAGHGVTVRRTDGTGIGPL